LHRAFKALRKTGANPTILSYNASAIKKSVLKANSFSSASKNALVCYNAAVAAVKSGANPTIVCYNASAVKKLQRHD
jgi:ABC-type thiamine transport system substrate-binding protein